jgi:hypothetical protein
LQGSNLRKACVFIRPWVTLRQFDDVLHLWGITDPSSGHHVSTFRYVALQWLIVEARPVEPCQSDKRVTLIVHRMLMRYVSVIPTMRNAG